ncbi:MAG: hypothetical protein AAGF10_06985, partial [Verrucomicrobiota bacterium]
MAESRELILSEVKRLSGSSGKAPGKDAFTEITGISEYEWSGYWMKWSDVIREAGLVPNEFSTPKLDDSEVLLSFAKF